MILPCACAAMSPRVNIGPISAIPPTQASAKLPMSMSTKKAAAIRGKVDGKNSAFTSFKMSLLLMDMRSYMLVPTHCISGYFMLCARTGKLARMSH